MLKPAQSAFRSFPAPFATPANNAFPPLLLQPLLSAPLPQRLPKYGVCTKVQVRTVSQQQQQPLRHKLSLLHPSPQSRPVPRTLTQSAFNSIANRSCVSMAAQTIERDVLPDNIKPIHYDLSIYDIELGGNFGYSGTVSIRSNIVKTTKEVVVNTHQITIKSAEVRLGQSLVKPSNITYDVPRQRATISFSEDLPESKDVLVVFDFTGTVNNSMAGFYRSKYKPPVTPAASVPKDGDSHVMFSTQFESCDARRAFPCFDEPNLKATFDFKIELPEDQVALSNMPEKETISNKPGYKVVSFETTPIMSTYLLAWAVGDFEYIEDFTKRKYKGKPLPVRVYTTRGLKEQARFALDHAPQVIDYFSEIFDIDYPLPKSDLLAVHEFSHGAMENWGLVTYRTTAVLFDENTSDRKYTNRIAYVVAHELAHQWFGNLVTMDWWDELWLNEGFATWVGWLATDKIHPEWNVWAQFVSEGMQTALNLDALRSSHPIEVPVKDALDVDQIFDAISYLKGSSVIRMLAAHLGRDTFLKGVSSYLKSHSFGNATTNDLWAALSVASGQDVNALMDPWIRKIGFPVVTIAEEPGQIGVRQARYLSTGDSNSADDETKWWIPLGLQGKSGASVANIALEKKEDTVREVDDSFYKVNTDNTGFYRTNYPPDRLSKLGKQLDRLTISDKIGLIADAGALALSGDASTSGLLALTEGFSEENSALVWSQIINSLATVKSVFSENAQISEGLQNFTAKLIGPAVKKIGWEPSAGDDLLTTQLRAQLITTAGINGQKGVIAEAQRRFDLYFSGKDTSAINSNLRSAIYSIVIRHGGSKEYHDLKKEWSATSSVDGKEIILRALGRLQDPELLADFLEFMNTTVPVQDIHTAANALSINAKTRDGLWKFIQKNFDPLYARLATNMVVWDRFIKMSLDRFSDKEKEQEIAKFFEGKDIRGYDRSLAIVSDTIRSRATYKERDSKIILEWLKAHGYA